MYKANIFTNKINKTSGSKLVGFIYQTGKDWKGTNSHGEWARREAQALRSADEQENPCTLFLKSSSTFFQVFFSPFPPKETLPIPFWHCFFLSKKIHSFTWQRWVSAGPQGVFVLRRQGESLVTAGSRFLTREQLTWVLPIGSLEP